MKITEINWHLYSKQFTESATHPRTLALITLIGYAIYQLLMPIRLGDTDMWYHLNGGRYFWDNMQIPSTSFFSFITPEKEWTNYFWGFQAIIYQAYDLGGYYGLAFLRSLLVILSAFIAYKIITTLLNKSPSIAFIVFISFILIFDGRTFQLRPHLFSYLFILALFYIFVTKNQLAKFLPIITILWANIHGVEWPVAALILGSYLLSTVIKSIKNNSLSYQEKIKIIVILSCPIFFMINPYGWQMYLAPFNIDIDANLYIQELQPIDLRQFFTIQITNFTITPNTAITCFTTLTLLAFYYSYKKKSLTPELLISTASLTLLFKGNRFLWEWLILTIPFISTQIYHLNLESKKLKAFKVIFIIVTALTLNTFYKKTLSFNDFPLNSIDIPTQTSDFLNSLKISGNILSAAGMNGYYEWELNGKYKTFINMQFPPSTDWEMFQEIYAFKSGTGLKHFTQIYMPDLIISNLKDNSEVINILKNFYNYSLIFTDDHSAIYSSKNFLAVLPNTKTLDYLDPVSLKNLSSNKIEYQNELKYLFQLNPKSKRVTRALFNVHRVNNDFEKALYYAEHYLSLDDKNSDALFITAVANQDIGNTKKSIFYFNQALEVTSEINQKFIWFKLAENHFILKDFSATFSYYKDHLNPYLTTFEPRQLYMYAYSAAMVGKTDQALKLFNMVLYISDINEDKKIHLKALEMKRSIENGEYEVLSFFEWLMHVIRSALISFF